MQNCAPVNFMMQHKHTHAHSFIKLQSNRDTDNRDKETNKKLATSAICSYYFYYLQLIL